MTITSREMCCAALLYAERGWPVIPLREGTKEPLIRWREQASTDPAEVERWWDRPYNIAVAVPEWYVVIDVDPRNGGVDTLRLLVSELGALPATRMAQTRDGGLHAWLRVPLRPNEIRSSLGPGVDVKKCGGYVVAPPSRVAPGQYRWLNSTRIATAPTAWIQRLRKRPRPKRVVQPVTDEVSARALAGWWCSVLRHTPEGHRNHQLYISAVNLAEVGILTPAVEHQLIDAATDAGLEKHEIEPTIASAMEAGK